MQQARLLLSIGAACLLAACAVGPDYDPPEVDVGAEWVGPSNPSAAAVDLETASRAGQRQP